MQSKIAFQEELLARLNDEVATHRMELDAMSHKLHVYENLLKDVLARSGEGGVGSQDSEPPPHY